jgi:hypothetical protein
MLVAFPNDLPSSLLTALGMDASPTSSTRNCGKPRWVAAVAFCNGCTRSCAVSESPRIVTSTKIASWERFGASTRATPGRAASRPRTSAAARVAAVPSSGPDRELIRTLSFAGSSILASCSQCWAWPDSPTAWSRLVALRVPAAWPIAKQTATNVSHSATARHG